MSDVKFNSSIPTIREANLPSRKNNESVNIQDNKSNNPQINTKDNMAAKEYKNSSFDPEIANVNFGENEEVKPQRPSMFGPILNMLLMIGSGAYAPESLEETQKAINENAKFIAQHGSAYDMNIFGGAKTKDEAERFKKMSETPKN